MNAVQDATPTNRKLHSALWASSLNDTDSCAIIPLLLQPSTLPFPRLRSFLVFRWHGHLHLIPLIGPTLHIAGHLHLEHSPLSIRMLRRGYYANDRVIDEQPEYESPRAIYLHLLPGIVPHRGLGFRLLRQMMHSRGTRRGCIGSML